jgi:hypothetical protein
MSDNYNNQGTLGIVLACLAYHAFFNICLNGLHIESIAKLRNIVYYKGFDRDTYLEKKSAYIADQRKLVSYIISNKMCISDISGVLDVLYQLRSSIFFDKNFIEDYDKVINACISKDTDIESYIKTLSIKMIKNIPD